jgi:hypothetical protein
MFVVMVSQGVKVCIKSLGFEGMDWIQLAQNNLQWQAVLNTAVNFQVP